MLLFSAFCGQVTKGNGFWKFKLHNVYVKLGSNKITGGDLLLPRLTVYLDSSHYEDYDVFFRVHPFRLISTE